MTIISIFYLVFCTIIYPLTKYTTIGNNERIMTFLHNKITNERLSNILFKLSYSKLLICRPCHSFWMSIAFLLFVLKLEPYLSILNALTAYMLADIKQEENDKE